MTARLGKTAEEIRKLDYCREGLRRMRRGEEAFHKNIWQICWVISHENTFFFLHAHGMYRYERIDIDTQHILKRVPEHSFSEVYGIGCVCVFCSSVLSVKMIYIYI